MTDPGPVRNDDLVAAETTLYPSAALTPVEFESFVVELLESARSEVEALRVTLHDKIEGIDGRYDFDATVRFRLAGMEFLVIIPGIPAALGNFVLPLHLGAKDVAFPKLNLMSYYMWIFGALFFLIGMIYERRHSRMIDAYGGITRRFIDDGGPAQ
jgi:hypothetical protein